MRETLRKSQGEAEAAASELERSQEVRHSHPHGPRWAPA